MHPRPSLLAALWMATYIGVQRRWRRLRGRCVLCGLKIGPATARWNIAVESFDPYYRSPMKDCCRWCNKRAQHGMNYGMDMSRPQHASR